MPNFKTMKDLVTKKNFLEYFLFVIERSVSHYWPQKKQVINHMSWGFTHQVFFIYRVLWKSTNPKSEENSYSDVYPHSRCFLWAINSWFWEGKLIIPCEHLKTNSTLKKHTQFLSYIILRPAKRLITDFW